MNLKTVFVPEPTSAALVLCALPPDARFDLHLSWSANGVRVGRLRSRVAGAV